MTADRVAILLNNRANKLQRRFDQQGDASDLDEAIEMRKEALDFVQMQISLLQSIRATCMNNYANSIQARFMKDGNLLTLDHAIKLHRTALEFQISRTADRGISLDNLGNALQTRYQRRGEVSDLEEAIELHKEALELLNSHSARIEALGNFARAIKSRYDMWGDLTDLEEAIGHHEETLSLITSEHRHHPEILNQLSTALQRRFSQIGDINDLNKAIELYSSALTACSVSHTSRGSWLKNLGSAHRTRFEHQGNVDDLEKAIQNSRDALALHAEPHPDYGLSLDQLAHTLAIRYQQDGGTNDLDEAIELHRKAVIFLKTVQNPARRDSLGSLAKAITARFQATHNSNDIEEAIQLHREGIALSLHSDPNYPMSLNNLASALLIRFEHARQRPDLEEAILTYREVVDRMVLTHPGRGSVLNNLANTLQTRFEIGAFGNLDDLNETFTLRRTAVTLLEPSHPGYSSILYNLATALKLRDERNLSDPASKAYLNEAISCASQSLEHCGPSNSTRGDNLKCLGLLLLLRGTSREDIERAILLFQKGATHATSPLLSRLSYAHLWGRTAVNYSLPSAMEAYQTAIGILSRLPALHLNLEARQEILGLAQGSLLSSGAAACAINQQAYDVAVEFLEASRSVFWAQAMNLRPPLVALEKANSHLADEFRKLSGKLEKASFRETSIHSPIEEHHQRSLRVESEGLRCRNLNQEWDALLSKIRSLSGFEGFLQPRRMENLIKAARRGPIVVLVADLSFCGALIISESFTREVEYLPLPEMTLTQAKFLVGIRQGLLTNNFHNFWQSWPSRSGIEAEEFPSTRLFGHREHGMIDSNEVFRDLLRRLWISVVKPIVEFIGLLKKSPSESPKRLWWCPTGPFSFLPLHAAGIYSELETDCLSNYAISSYTPTLATLLDPPKESPRNFKMTVVIQPKALNMTHLPEIEKELEAIRKIAPKETLITRSGNDVLSPAALLELQQSSIVHFACHGIQDANNPLESGLLLSDCKNERLTVSQLMRGTATGDNHPVDKVKSLAFLSACETAKGDQNMPDEAMHLAATLLFAGFRGVIATMWTMMDADGPKIADVFYQQLFKDCNLAANPPVVPDVTKAAEALHFAVCKLRDEGVEFKQWVPFVHYGL
ncbi:CHAT domain-containing protein [Mycena crocata]|nr:CHAT domain-containing protein [Mycena crocata]